MTPLALGDIVIHVQCIFTYENIANGFKYIFPIQMYMHQWSNLFFISMRNLWMSDNKSRS